MANTPLLTIRCPQDLIELIEKQAQLTRANKTTVIIEMLRQSVPSLSIYERTKLPNLPAIYFVITSSNKLLYIGMSQNLNQRWYNHHRYQQFIESDPNCKICWLGFDAMFSESIADIERELISELDTQYNRIGKNGKHTTQINIRIDYDFLTQIKEAAKKSGIPYTEWIIEVCKEKLRRSEKEEESIVKRVSTLEQEIKNLKTQTPQNKVSNTDGLSNAELARLVKVSSATVSRWSTGKRQQPKELNWEFKKELGRWYERTKDERTKD